MIQTTIILCGGPINYTNVPVGTNLSNAMIPVNGRPVISWILDDLLQKGIEDITVVMRRTDTRMQTFLQWAYQQRLTLRTALLAETGTIIDSLAAGLAQKPEATFVRVVLGDTLIRDTLDFNDSFVYAGRVSDAQRWCLVTMDEDDIITDYQDKQPASPDGSSIALAGYYQFSDGLNLRQAVNDSQAAHEKEISNVLRRYEQTNPIRVRLAEQWFDFGHIDKLADARRRLLRPRAFNALTVDPVLNTISKVSEHHDTLQDELEWYLRIPEPLKVLTPRIISHEQQEGRLHIVQEYYGYPSLSELYVYGDLSEEMWFSMLQHLMRIHGAFRSYTAPLTKGDQEKMYLQKTKSRLSTLIEQDQSWETLLGRDLVVNGTRLLSYRALEEELGLRLASLIDNGTGCIMHGDFCFSNILFDVSHQIVRLIDPRGRFGQKGIYGDPRYDMAKLRHSVGGLYDFIVADLFDVDEEDGEFIVTICANGRQKAIAHKFDQMVAEYGYDPAEIRLLEALLFISMLPLHHDYPRRQLMMYITGLTRLNEVLCASSSTLTAPSAR